MQPAATVNVQRSPPATHAERERVDVDEFDKQQNDHAVKDGSRILSAYQTPAGKLWLITESDRSATTFLLPDEY